jgi:hypothetical protein
MFDDFSNIFNTIVARSIYLYYIDHLFVCKGETVDTFSTRIPIGQDTGTIHSLWKNTGQRRLARSMESKEDISMMNLVISAWIHQDLFYKSLTYDIIKYVWSIFLIEGLMRGFRHTASIGKYVRKQEENYCFTDEILSIVNFSRLTLLLTL